MSKNNKTNKYKTRKYRKDKSKTKRKRGGTTRTEEIHVNLGRQHTNPDIKSEIRLFVGPTAYPALSKGDYIRNFFAETAKSFEEDIAVIINGAPKSLKKNKIFTFKYNDNDAPLEKGSTKKLKCKKPKKTKETDKTDKK